MCALCQMNHFRKTWCLSKLYKQKFIKAMQWIWKVTMEMKDMVLEIFKFVWHTHSLWLNEQGCSFTHCSRQNCQPVPAACDPCRPNKAFQHKLKHLSSFLKTSSASNLFLSPSTAMLCHRSCPYTCLRLCMQLPFLLPKLLSLSICYTKFFTAFSL